MDENQNEESLQFYSFLCGIIGTEEVINRRRQIFAVKDDCDALKGLIVISSGSKAEGLEQEGSDYDFMIVRNDGLVVESVHEKREHTKGHFIMETENVKPGFTKLKPDSDDILSDCIDTINGVNYLSSKLFRQNTSQPLLDLVSGCHIHGPCTSTPKEDLDIAMSLLCQNWISHATPWIMRTKYSWVSNEVLNNIINFGVLFVPIGSKYSPHMDLEWRISFSYAEKHLIYSFNHVQFFCYAHLKLLLKDIIKKTYGDLLCSYFIKTIMFWLCEETEVSYWRADNMLPCFMTCLRRLIYCVESKTCLHYFIPENNLFENRFTKLQHKSLLSTIYGLYRLGWRCLLQTKTLKPFRDYVHRESSLSSEIRTVSYLSFLWYLDTESFGVSEHNVSIKRCLYMGIRSKKSRDFYIFFLSRLFQALTQKRINYKFIPTDNKVMYQNSRRNLAYLLIGVHNDAMSGWLLLASFFYTHKQYFVCKKLIEYCLTKSTSERCKIYLAEQCMIQQDHFMPIQKTIGRKTLKYYTINSIKFVKHSPIIPADLRNLSQELLISDFPPLIYGHFLNYLVHHEIKDEREKRKAYDNLYRVFNATPSFTRGQQKCAVTCLEIADEIELKTLASAT